MAEKRDGGYRIVASALYRNLEAEWLFPQEKTNLYTTAMSIGEAKMP
jgi:hypothetical protein